MSKIDSHHHLWRYDPVQYPWIDDAMSVLKRDYLFEELAGEIDAADISGVVSVQARQCLEETLALLEIAVQHPRVVGVVGWLPLASAELDRELDRLADQAFFKGVRHVVQDEPDDEFILGSDFNRGVAQLAGYDLAYDILVFPRQLPATIRFVDRHPQQRFVLDHLAKPRVDPTAFDDAWETDLRQLARRENVMCKFSGVVTEVRGGVWSPDTLRPYWDVALDAFGPQRLMFGSDWPVCLLRTGYQRWTDCVSQLSGELSASERQAFWSANAVAAYRLDMTAFADEPRSQVNEL